MVNGWAECVQGWWLPPTCVICGGGGQAPVLDLCTGCAADLPRNTPCCATCGVPITADQHGTSRCSDVAFVPSAALPFLRCPTCLAHAPPFDSAVIPFAYEWPVDRLLKLFKYQSDLAVGRVLGTLLGEAVRSAGGPLPQVIIPVPLHPRRQRERGFNQAAELARALRRDLGIAVDLVSCRRTRETRDQTELSARQRRRNVRDAFGVSSAGRLRHVAVLDDVMTTGSTASALASALKAAGVQKVDVWAVARAVLRREAAGST